MFTHWGALFTQFHLPLLTKELQEQSARRKTYIIRVVYVTLFCLLSLMVIIPEIRQRGSHPLSVLGVGKQILIVVFAWQFLGVYLFLPGATCGVITSEKERNTLGLLFLTRLNPAAIVWEKLLGRLVPMILVMACGLPLTMLSISLGGVETKDIFNGIYFLILTALQVSAVSLACSSFFRTTVAALFASYIVLFSINFGISIVDYVVCDQAISEILRQLISRNTTIQSLWYDESQILLPFFGFLQFIAGAEASMRGHFLANSYWATVVRGLPILLISMIALGMSQYFLVKRAFINPCNPLIIGLRWLDQSFQYFNRKFASGITFSKSTDELPIDNPIAWRETQKRSLGQPRYLLRILLGLFIPTFLISIYSIWSDAGQVDRYTFQQPGSITMVVLLEWAVVAMLITATSAGVIAGERGHQTFDVLMSLPMTSEQILREKLIGMHRLIAVCAIPLLVAICFEAWWRDIAGPQPWGYNVDYRFWHYLATAISLVLLYLPLLGWLSFLVGIHFQSAGKAVLAAMIVVVTWCVLPLMGIFFVWEVALRWNLGRLEESQWYLLIELSPLGLLLISETDALSKLSPSPFIPLIYNSILYGGLLLAIKWYVWTHAGKLLGRSREGTLKSEGSQFVTRTPPSQVFIETASHPL